MIRLPNYPRIQFAEKFDATTSLIDLGANRCPYPTAQTICAVVFPVGAGELGTNTVLAVTGSANNNGPRMSLGDAAGFNVKFNANSTGTAGSPQRGGNDILAYSAWHFTAATWDGGLLATGIRLFYARDGRDLVESTYTAPIDGTTAASYGVGNNLVIGNRGDAGRTFNGSIAYTAWFNRVLTPQELVMVRSRGPLVFVDSLLLLRANRKDYGPYEIEARARTAITQSSAPTYLFPLGYAQQRRLIVGAAAASTFNASWNVGANTVVQPGALQA